MAGFGGPNFTGLAREVVVTASVAPSNTEETLRHVYQIGVRIGGVRPPHRRAKFSTTGARQRRRIRFRHSAPAPIEAPRLARQILYFVSKNHYAEELVYRVDPHQLYWNREPTIC